MSRPKKAPAFQFYARDWLSSQSVALMSFAAQATYVRLLCHQFIGFVLPTDPEAVRKLTACTPKEWRTVWPELAPHFPEVEGGRANPKLAEQVEETTAYKERRTTAAQTANAVRWGHVDGPPPDPKRKPPKRPNRTPTEVRIGPESDSDRASDSLSDSVPLQSAYCTTPPSPAAAGEVPPRGGRGGEPRASPWPDPTTAAAAAVLATERGVSVAGLEAVCRGWAETGLDADRGQPVGWPAVAKAVRDYAGADGKRWHAASFAGYVRSAVRQLGAQRDTTTPVPADGPRARCAALLAGEGFAAPTAAWATALGTDLVHARRVLAAVRPAADGAPTAVLVELLVSERDRVAVEAA